MSRWPHLIGRPISSQMWDRIWSSTFKYSRCVLHRETSIRVLMFWYKTPKVFHKFDPSSSANCWHYGSEIGSLFHIFWQCSMIQPFWHEVMLLIQKVVDVSLLLDTLNYFLGLPFPGITKQDNRLIAYILLAAKWLIPLFGLSHSPPHWSRFLQLIAEIRGMEYMTASVHDSIPQFNKIWELWDQSEFGTPHYPLNHEVSHLVLCFMYR